MSEIAISPYLNLQGRSREAMEFYQRVLGGTLDLLAFNPEGAPKPAAPGDRIMHARLATNGASILATDGMPEYPPTVGDNFAIVLNGSDRDRLTKAFTALSDGGKVKQPLKTESWGDTFGWLVDRFGINWMINISSK
ncbi:MAG TPA: VOC family protein [Candidatus Saccharimonadales bacterium]|nr:VOC family protein [Candidatus Saccharimonadales bacterium]